MGDVFVLRPGAKPEVRAENELGEICMATPAIAGNRLLIRSAARVYCVRREKGSGAKSAD